MSSAISAKTSRLLALPSGNRCAIPDCHDILIEPATATSPRVFLGEMAHIRGERPGAARYDPSMTDEERNSAENLIMMCRKHARLIDVQEAEYPVQRLLAMKRDHESWVDACLSDAVSRVTFVELEAVSRGISAAAPAETIDLFVSPPLVKLRKNLLSATVERLVTLGMANTHLVTRYLEAVSGVDGQFAERLTEGFKAEYLRRSKQGMSGDELFFALQSFASQRREVAPVF